MNKTEIQSRIDALQEDFDSKLASLKADLAKCDCADGIEQEKCWCCLNDNGWVISSDILNRREAVSVMPGMRPAYMPECRQVTAEDAERAHAATCVGNTWLDSARELHKLGFRIKVTP